VQAIPESVDVAGLGGALIDALIRIDETELLAEEGFPRGCTTMIPDARWQGLYQRLGGADTMSLQSGGSCANTIATLGLMGATARFCGQVGRDHLGDIYARALTEACGGHCLHKTGDHPTGKCLSVVSIQDAERTMLSDMGAAVHLAGLGDFDEVIRRSGMLYLTGYALLGPPMRDRAMEAIAIANQAQIPVALSAADPFVVEATADLMRHLLEEFVDVAFFNKHEARALTGLPPEEAARLLAEDVDIAVVTLSAEGSLVRRGDEQHRCAAHLVEAVDATGAGDAFAAGFLFGLAHDWPLPAAADLGSRVAALTVGQLGAVVRDRSRLQAAVSASQPR